MGEANIHLAVGFTEICKRVSNKSIALLTKTVVRYVINKKFCYFKNESVSPVLYLERNFDISKYLTLIGSLVLI